MNRKKPLSTNSFFKIATSQGSLLSRKELNQQAPNISVKIKLKKKTFHNLSNQNGAQDSCWFHAKSFWFVPDRIVVE